MRNIVLASCLLFVCSAYCQKIVTKESMDLTDDVISIVESYGSFNITKDNLNISGSTTEYIFNGHLLSKIISDNDTGRKVGAHHYTPHGNGINHLDIINYKGSHVKRGRVEYSEKFYYSHTNPDTIFDIEIKYNFDEATSRSTKDTIKTILGITTYTKNGKIERWQEFSSGKLFKDYRYLKNTEEMDLHTKGALNYTEVTSFKNDRKKKTIRKDAEGNLLLTKHYGYDDKGNLNKIEVDKENTTTLAEQSVYLYKGDQWVVRCYQMYDKGFYNPETLKLKVRSVTLKDGTKLEATEEEIKAFVKKQTAIALKPEA